MAAPLPVPEPAQQPTLRPVEHPDMSDALTHFCDRARPSEFVEDRVRAMTPEQRLESILRDERLLVHITFSGGDPALCLTEATGHGLRFLIGSRGYRPWGLVFHRQAVFDAGGAPVWYARPEEYQVLRELAPRLQSWSVRLEPGRSDWLEEREWRIPRPFGSPGISLHALRPSALLVGSPDWTPARLHHEVFGPTGTPALDDFPVLPNSAIEVPRLWWDGRDLQELPPLQNR